MLHKNKQMPANCDPLGTNAHQLNHPISRHHPTLEEHHNISDRELLTFKAQICEQAARYEDMVQVMNELCAAHDDLKEEERNLLSCAYKNVIGIRRTSWRILNESIRETATSTTTTTTTSIEDDNGASQEQPNPEVVTITTSEQPNKYNPKVIESFLKLIESELKQHCGNIIDILTKRLIPSLASSGESRVFYYKMKGDYIRYLCEISSASDKKEKSNESLTAYMTASDKAMIELPPTHPVRLGLMLNFSVFYYDIMRSPERSCRLAKQAFDDAIAELDTLSEESYRDSTIIMQLLRDNLNLWESEQSLVQNNVTNNNNEINP